MNELEMLKNFEAIIVEELLPNIGNMRADIFRLNQTLMASSSRIKELEDSIKQEQ